MKDRSFVKDILEDNEIFRLEGGTKYLPSIYIQNNAHWNKWMVFECKTHEPVTNRTFNSKEDCIEFIKTYDEQSESTLNSLYSDIDDPLLSACVKKIDLSNPKQVRAMTSDNHLALIVHSQKLEIAELENVDIRKVKLISFFYQGLISLFFQDTDDPDERVFYIFDNGRVRSYPAWKTVSVAMALINSLKNYSKEETLYKKLNKLVGKALISIDGHGFIFDKHFPHTNLMFAQKVRVIQANSEKTASPNSPLTPMFLCKVEFQEDNKISIIQL
ncbi:MAG: hypothetical protein CR966_00555 [Pseudomonadales bacterium]|nr:MAG: hypothetical protein CR966_00555 [Pseudomonadales bacterium]